MFDAIGVKRAGPKAKLILDKFSESNIAAFGRKIRNASLRGGNISSLHGGQWGQGGGRGRFLQFRRQELRYQRGADGMQHRVFEHRLQFPDIARPGVLPQPFHGFRRDASKGLADLGIEDSDVMLHEGGMSSRRSRKGGRRML